MSKQVKASELLQKLKRIPMECSDIEDSEFSECEGSEPGEKEIEICNDNSNSDISDKENESSESEPENILNVRKRRRARVLSSSESETESVQASPIEIAVDGTRICKKRYHERMNNNRQMPQLPAGNPQMDRNARRMYNYNMEKYRQAPLPERWSDDVEPQPRPSNRPSQPRSRQRAQAWKSGMKNTPNKKDVPAKEIKDPAEVTPAVVKAKSENLMDEPLWQDGPIMGTHPVNRIYTQNMDLSTFPLLLERTYLDLEVENSRLRREMPFCAYQHVMTSVLNAAVIDHVKTVNAEDRYADEESPLNLIPDDFVMPAPVAEYIKCFANTTTPQGDLVRANVPVCAVPNPHIDDSGDIPEQPAGGFGVCSSANYNSYECYVSPLVTARLINATVEQNQNHQYGPWQPLPAAMTPIHGIPTLNLLGCRPNVERLNPEGLQKIQDISFPNGNDMQSRVQWSPELVARVSGTLKSMDTKYKMHFGKPVHGHNTFALGWIVVELVGGGTIERNSARLSTYSGRIDSSAALGSSQAYAAFTLGLRKERTDQARGLCYTTTGGAVLPGWSGTINSNFEMIEPYSPTIGNDMPLLRHALHTSESPTGDRGTVLTSWLRRNYLIKKDIRR
ncbi:hypothetical protein ANTPLA_LOCUS8021, partial [Anthophora plagiata]